MPASKAVWEVVLAGASLVEPSLVLEAKLWHGGQAEEEDGWSASQSYLLGRAMVGQEVLVRLLAALPFPPSMALPRHVLPFVFQSGTGGLPIQRCEE